MRSDTWRLLTSALAMFRSFLSRWVVAKPEKYPPMRNAHYLGLHIAEATRKAGYGRWR